MDYQLDNKRSHESLSCLASSTIITSFDSAYNSNFQQQKHHHNGSFISLRCRPTLTTLPPELLSKISYNLSLCDYSFLSRTCARLHSHLFHPAELVLFLKTRYRLSIQSGSIIIFAYLANMQVRAPVLLERIFEDFFADSPLRLQEEQEWKLHCQQQRRQLSNNTYQLNQAIISKVNSSASYDNSSSLEYQRMDGIEVHKAAEKARRQAKSDAVRMLGVLYALDKTHIGPSSSTNALVLIGAYDPSEPTPPAPAPAPAPALSLSTVTETKATTALDTTAFSSSVVFAPSFFSATAHATAPIPVNSPFSSFSKAITATTTADADAEDTAAPTPSFMYHAAPSLLSASELSPPSSRQRTGQGPSGRFHSLQEGYGQQDLDTTLRSRSTSLDHSDLARQHQQHQATINTRNVRKRPSPSIPSKDEKMSSSSSSSWWESPLIQQHAQTDISRFSPSRALSPASVRHQRQRSPPSFSPSSSSASLTSVSSLVVTGSKSHQSGREEGTEGGAVSGGGASAPADTTASTSGGVRPGSPSRTSTSPASFSPTSSLFSSTSTPSLTSSSAISFPVLDEARQRFFDRRNKRHMNLRAMMNERAMDGNQEAMECVEYSHELARRGCWPSNLDQDYDMDTAYCRQPRVFGERDRDSKDGFDDTVAEAFAFGMHEMVNLPMDIDGEYVVRGSVAASSSNGGGGGGSGMGKYMRLDLSDTPATTIKHLSPSSSSSSCPSSWPVASAVSLAQQVNNKSKTSSLSSFKEPLPSSSSSIASCSSHSPSSYAQWPVLLETEKDREDGSVFGVTPLGISVPLIEVNTNSSGDSSDNGWLHGGGNRNIRNGSGSSLSSCRMDAPSVMSSSALFGAQGVSFTYPRGGQNHQQQQQQQSQSQQPLPRSTPPITSTFLSTSTTAPPTSTTTTTVMNTNTTAGTQQKMQQALNRHDKIAFLTKYTDRMHLKLQALGIEDWGQGDIQRKKTYQLMIQHNDKTGEKDLVKFYLGRYGGSVTTSGDGAATDVGTDVQDQQPMEPLGLPLPLASPRGQGQGQGEEQQGTPLIVQA